MSTPRKHAAVIKAWADGATVETKIGGEWCCCNSPVFAEEGEYRVKLEPLRYVTHCAYVGAEVVPLPLANMGGQRVAFTVDPTTKRILSVNLLVD